MRLVRIGGEDEINRNAQYYQLIFDVLSINLIVYLVDDVADLMWNGGNNRKFGQQREEKNIQIDNEKKTKIDR